MSIDTRRLRSRAPALTWVQTSLLAGLVLTVGWSVVGGHGLNVRLLRDGAFFLVAPLALAVAAGKSPATLGWRVDRRAVRNTLGLALFVLPFYVVGSSLPTIRSYYPMWGLSTTATVPFLAYAAKQMLVVVAAETYYRGLLCVGVRDLGRKAALISPVVYAVHHAAKPPIELALSGPTDVLFGLVDYDAESILPSVVAHGLGLTLLDWLVLHEPVVPTATVLRWLRWLPLPL